MAIGVVPPGGDNVTMQQLMKTMRALQEAVAASRVEIAASQADNEELRKELQQAGERAMDERAPLIPLRGTSHVVLSGDYEYRVGNHVSGPESHLHRCRGPRGSPHDIPHPDDANRGI